MQWMQFVVKVAGSIALVATVSGCGTASSLPQLPPVADSQYTIGPGDKVRISVYGIEALNDQVFVVNDTGVLSLPMIDKMPAAGKTFEELEQSIKQAFLDRKILNDPFVNVQPAALRPFYILGEVGKPGEYEYRPGLSVLAAVSMAGGFTYRANEKEVVISRTIDQRKVEGRAGPDALVRPGDRIQVAERWF